MIQGAIKQFYRDHQVPSPINITLTQKQVVEGQRIDDATSEANFKHFRNLLNSRLFGNAYKRYGCQLSIFVVRESSAWHRHHIHAVIEKPFNLTIEEFIAIVIQCWTKTNFGYNEHHFEEPADQDRATGWINYCLKRGQRQMSRPRLIGPILPVLSVAEHSLPREPDQ